MMQVLDQIQRDHRNMRLLLELVEEQMDAYHDGRVPDFELLRSIAEYTLHYPDLFHHPKEELVLERLLARDPAAKAAVGDLAQEHKHLAELTRRFAVAMANAARDVEIPRAWLEGLAKEYLAANLEHMQLEETQFLPRARAVLTDEDWAEIDAKAQHGEDPIFGAKAEEGYLAIYERIRNLRL